MSIEIFFNYFNVIFIALFALSSFSLFFAFKQKQRLDVFLKSGEKDFEGFLKEQIEKIEKLEKDLEKKTKEITELKKISKISFQKIGLIRFNPFKEVGSDQSFSIALLDSNNNGFVISSHYGRDFCRIYTKEIKKAKSSYSLSKEEEKAIEKAISGV